MPKLVTPATRRTYHASMLSLNRCSGEYISSFGDLSKENLDFLPTLMKDFLVHVVLNQLLNFCLEPVKQV